MEDAVTLISIVSRDRLLDAGSGVVLSHSQNDLECSTYVLTCAHNIRAHRPNLNGENKSNVLVNGIPSNFIQDDKLASYDLAILTVPSKIGASVKWSAAPLKKGKILSKGFVKFYKSAYKHHSIETSAWNEFRVTTALGANIEYLTLRGKLKEWFEKGMSGGPVFDSDMRLIAIARIFDDVEKDGNKQNIRAERSAYAIRLTSSIGSLINQVCGFEVLSKERGAGNIQPDLRGGSLNSENDYPPKPPVPKEESIRADDLQKHRWGGKATKWPYELRIERVIEYSRYFVFDAVVTSAEGDLKGPFIFHLHDSYKPKVVWVRKTDGRQAMLSEIGSNGIYTIGVQFRVSNGRWLELEYDLAQFDAGRLKRYTG